MHLGRPLVNRAVSQHLSRPPRLAVLGEYPPARCGAAESNAALVAGLDSNRADVTVVRVADGSDSSDARVVGELVGGSAVSSVACANLLNQRDIAIVHYASGGCVDIDGAQLVDVLGELQVPSILVAHSIPADPSVSEWTVFEQLASMADHVVVATDAAAGVLNSAFAVPRHRVSVVGNGATIPLGVAVKRAGRPTLLTWGLVAPGMGVERVIEAMDSLRELRGRPRYAVAGPTHPVVVARDGEAYRDARIEQARRQGLTDSVVFDATHRTGAALAALVQSSAAVVVPYDANHHDASRVLVNAVASGRPVVATSSPEAVELLGTGAGIIADGDDPEALAAALRRVLTDPRLAGNMAAEGRRLAPGLAWSLLASSYVALAQRVLRERHAQV
jgi:glycosyltransferase involved in cell wall biosynthesis